MAGPGPHALTGPPRRPAWLLPGLDGTGRLYDPLVPLLSSAFDVRIVTYPRDLARYDALLAAIERPPPGTIVVGESFGGPLAILLAARDPDRVAAVVLVATFVRPPVAVPGAALFAGLVHPPPIWAIRLAMLDRGSPPEIAVLLHDAVASVPRRTIVARVAAVSRIDVRAELAALPGPVTWIAATRDRLVGSRATTIARRARPELDVLEIDGPHLLAQARPRDVSAAIGDVADRHARRS